MDELICFFSDDFEIETVNLEESVGCGKCDTLVSV
jgi:hypothetical protein